MEKSVLKEFLKEDIVHFSGKESFKKVTKKSIINYTGSTLGNAFKSVLKGNKRATKDNMLDSILEMRREEDIQTRLLNQQLRDGLVTYEFRDTSLPSQVLLPMNFGPPPPVGLFEPTLDPIYEDVRTMQTLRRLSGRANLAPPPIRSDEALDLLEIIHALDQRRLAV